jgi:hypothetical protein
MIGGVGREVEERSGDAVHGYIRAGCECEDCDAFPVVEWRGVRGTGVAAGIGAGEEPDEAAVVDPVVAG